MKTLTERTEAMLKEYDELKKAVTHMMIDQEVLPTDPEEVKLCAMLVEFADHSMELQLDTARLMDQIDQKLDLLIKMQGA